MPTNTHHALPHTHSSAYHAPPHTSLPTHHPPTHREHTIHPPPQAAANLFPGMTNIPLRDMIQRGTGFGVPTSLVNDADAAVMAECWVGAARDQGAGSVRNLVFLTLGSGIGAGMVVDGEVREHPYLHAALRACPPCLHVCMSACHVCMSALRLISCLVLEDT